MPFYVASKIMGGDWKNYSNEEGTVMYALLEGALCQAAMLQSRIREAMVFSVTPGVITSDDGEKIDIHYYDQVAHYPLLK